MIQGISHVAIAVRSIKDALKVYGDALGLKVTHAEEVKSEHVRVAMIEFDGTRIELLEPTGPESPITKFLEKHGEGIHHIALKVNRLSEAMDSAKQSGLQLIYEEPRLGARGSKITFLHPKSTRGVLLEFCEEP